MRLIIVILISLLATACDPKDLPPATVADICVALIGPIKYNSENPQSARFAAYLLALDLHQRNEVGRRLKCPKFN